MVNSELDLRKYIREIPDYPIKGVNFKDITTLIKDKDAFAYTIDKMSEPFLDRNIDKLVDTPREKMDLLYQDTFNTKERTTIDVEGVFPYIGADPNTAFVKDLGITDLNGYIIANSEMETAIPGIYGAGDCNFKTLRQIVTATSDGAIAAQNAFHYINK